MEIRISTWLLEANYTHTFLLHTALNMPKFLIACVQTFAEAPLTKFMNEVKDAFY